MDVETDQQAHAPQALPEETFLPANDLQTTVWSAVLAAAGLEYRLERRPERWVLLVPAACATAARREIAAYEADEAAVRHKPATVTADAFLNPGLSPLAAGGLLLILYWRLGSYNRYDPLLRAAAGDSAAILAGEWWRALTALTLHAGVAHLAGNVISLTLLGWAVGRLWGSGLGWVLILAAGMGGNLATALLGSAAGHVGVGASTAVFGALGLLAGQRAVRNLAVYGMRGGIWSRPWLPLAAGLALLGIMGAGPRSDLAAHAFGLAAGILLGIPFGFRPPPRLSAGTQRLLQLAGLLALIGAWRAAILSLR